MTDSRTEQIAARVRGVKAERGFTNEDLARIIGVDDRKTVGVRLSGRVAFTAPEILRFAEATGEPVTRFFPEPSKASA